jgi:hypothetical protein
MPWGVGNKCWLAGGVAKPYNALAHIGKPSVTPGNPARHAPVFVLRPGPTATTVAELICSRAAHIQIATNNTVIITFASQ